MSNTDRTSQVTNAELLSMTRDLDDLHHDVTLPALQTTLDEWAEDIRAREAAGEEDDDDDNARSFFDRRKFLVGVGGVAGALALAACSSSTTTRSAASAPASGTAAASGATAGGEGQALSGDLRVVGMAASLENSGIAAYMSGIKAATAGKLGTVPPAIVTFAKTAMAQHEDHQKAWNSVLTGSGKKPVTAVDPVVQPVINSGFAKVKDVTGLAQLALMVENIAGQTYQNGLMVIKSPAGIKTAASIEPVEFQHAAILSYVLGKYPVPDAFTKVTSARPVTDYRS